MKPIIIFTILLYLSSLILCAQDATFYIQIEDPELVPAVSVDLPTNELKVVAKTKELNDLYGKYKIKKFKQAFPTAPTSWLRKVYLVKCNDENLGQELKNKFKEKVPLVEYLCEPMLTYTPNDYGLAYSQTYLDLINAKQAWDISGDLPKITVAITDTYFDLNHEDIDFAGLQGNNNPSVSRADHGTTTAGAIAAITDNGIGLASVGFRTPVYASTNVFDDNEVLLLAQAGYRVISCSWYNACSFSSAQDSLYDIIRNVYGSIAVFSAGNYANQCFSQNNYCYPASYDANVSVTSVGHMYDIGYVDPIYGANNWKDVHQEVIGDTITTHHHNDAVDICAAGYHVGTTYVTGTGVNGGNYGAVWGTSIASPQVAGVLATIISINPCLSADEAVDILLNTTDASIYTIPENSPYIGRLGEGRLDAYAAALSAAESATLSLHDLTLTSQDIKSNYGINILGNVNIASSHTVNFITRKEFTTSGSFEVPLGSSIEINVNPNNPTYCP